MFKDSYLLEKGMNEQKEQQKKGNIAVLHLNPCDDLAKANQIMKENNCSDILCHIQLIQFHSAVSLVT